MVALFHFSGSTELKIRNGMSKPFLPTTFFPARTNCQL